MVAPSRNAPFANVSKHYRPREDDTDLKLLSRGISQITFNYQLGGQQHQIFRLHQGSCHGYLTSTAFEQPPPYKKCLPTFYHCCSLSSH